MFQTMKQILVFEKDSQVLNDNVICYRKTAI